MVQPGGIYYLSMLIQLLPAMTLEIMRVRPGSDAKTFES